MLQSKIIELQNLYYNMCGFQITKLNNIPLNELTLEKLQIQIDYLNKWNFYISNCIDALPNKEFIQELLG